ncbi:MAG: alpha/beta fold hydrolase [Phenylobacterium sp.]|uniref:alpha/beta fold hydrolase n=1 Tax=Phenylobacterium sp. TaxID=1871053 RepID=UPI001A55049C|nr:alpha/beta fold hydrolase [Phenylobacterium sp.]MBL8556566.1 alpha/beta fold hydrolase [Phenylobacterium sp.]
MSGADAVLSRPDGVRIAWRRDGAADAPAVLLCSMATAALGIWDGATAALAERYAVLRYDRRGDGDSDAGPPASHTLDTHLADALAVLDAAGCARASVCGMAYGARVATRMALQAPERVGRLILFDATGGPPAPEAVRATGSAQARALRDAAAIPTPRIDRRWFARRDPEGAGVSARTLAGHPAWTDGLAAIAVPTFLATGEQDPNLEGSRRMAREIPGAELHVMPMTGHASLLDRPDLVLRLLEQFLSAQRSAFPT